MSAERYGMVSRADLLTVLAGNPKSDEGSLAACFGFPSIQRPVSPRIMLPPVVSKETHPPRFQQPF